MISKEFEITVGRYGSETGNYPNPEQQTIQIPSPDEEEAMIEEHRTAFSSLSLLISHEKSKLEKLPHFASQLHWSDETMEKIRHELTERIELMSQFPPEMNYIEFLEAHSTKLTNGNS